MALITNNTEDAGLRIRQASQQDLDILVEFNQKLALETEKRPLDVAILRKSMQAILDDERKGVYLLLMEGEEVLGQIMYVLEWSTWRNANFMWITDLYIKPKHRRRGLFHVIVNYAMNLYKERRDVIGLRFYVDKGNTKVIPLYKKIGWKESNYNLWEIKKDGVQ